MVNPPYNVWNKGEWCKTKYTVWIPLSEKQNLDKHTEMLTIIITGYLNIF